MALPVGPCTMLSTQVVNQLPSSTFMRIAHDTLWQHLMQHSKYVAPAPSWHIADNMSIVGVTIDYGPFGEQQRAICERLADQVNATNYVTDG
jgi:hypothetical protein